MESQAIEIQKFEQVALTWPDRARAITIIDQVSYDQAANLIQGIAGLEKQIKDHHAPIKEAANKAHKAAVAAEKKLLDPLAEAKKIIQGGLITWTQKQEALRLEAQRRAEEAARKVADEMALAAAVEAEKNGASQAEVEAVLQERPIVPAPVIQPTYNKAAGIGMRTNWHAEVVDIKALCQAVVEGKVAQTLVLPNEVALNNMARALKEQMNVPGVKAVNEQSLSVRRS